MRLWFAVTAAILVVANSPADADEALSVRLEVKRTGHSYSERHLPNVRDEHNRTHWDFGTYRIETRFPLDRTEPVPLGRQHVLDVLGNWSDHIDKQLDRLDAAAQRKEPEPERPPAPTTPSFGQPELPDIPTMAGYGIRPIAKNLAALDMYSPTEEDLAYFRAIAPELKRVLDHATTMQDNVTFLRGLLIGIHHYESTNGDVRLPSDTVISREEGSGSEKWYQISHALIGSGSTIDVDTNETIKIGAWTTEDAPERQFNPRIFVSTMTLEQGDLARLQNLIDQRADTHNAFTFNIEQLGLTPDQRKRLEEHTASFLHLVLRDAYDQALRDVVRYIWFLSHHPFPDALTDTTPDTPLDATRWHNVMASEKSGNIWRDWRSVPIIPANATLVLPDVEAKTLMHVLFPLWGHLYDNEMRRPNAREYWGGLVVVRDFEASEIETELDHNMRHAIRSDVIALQQTQSLTWLPENTYKQYKFGGLFVQPMNPVIGSRNAGTGYGHFYGTHETLDEHLTSYPALAVYNQHYYHELTMTLDDMSAYAELAFNYSLQEDTSDCTNCSPNETYSHSSTDAFKIAFMLGDGTPVMRTRRAPGAAPSAMP